MEKTEAELKNLKKLYSLYAEVIQNSYETQDSIFDFISKTTTEFLSFINIKTRFKNRVSSKKETYFEF